ncbi:MAG: LCP family protein [Acidimicrobiia bacterium]|nr:LCP family protein [Acidimicrobiia bacterium]
MKTPTSSLRAFLIRFGTALVAVFALTGLAVAGAYWETNRQVDSIRKVEITGLDTSESVPAEAGNFVIIGSDSRDALGAQVEGDEEQLGSERSDTLMVAHVDPDQKTGLLVSFPRDLWVEIPGHGENKINAAFSIGGPQLVIDTLQANFDIPITNYIEIDFAGFEGIVDAIGGVPVYFEGPARDGTGPDGDGGSGFVQPYPGCFELQGDRALQYVRSRYYEVYDGSQWVSDPTADLGRINRQQAFMRSLASEALANVGANPLRARSLADEVLSNMTVDQTLGTRDVLGLVDAFRVVDPNSEAFESVTIPNEGGFADGQSVLFIVQPQADELMARLRTFGPPPVPEEAPVVPDIEPFTVSVSVLNGSGVDGAAGATLDGLVNQGFGTGGVGNADFVEQTEVHYAPGNEEKAELVRSYLGGVGELVEDATVQQTDVQVVIGGDFVGVAPPDQVEPPEPVEPPPTEVGEAPPDAAEEPPPEEANC